MFHPQVVIVCLPELMPQVDACATYDIQCIAKWSSVCETTTRRKHEGNKETCMYKYNTDILQQIYTTCPKLLWSVKLQFSSELKTLGGATLPHSVE